MEKMINKYKYYLLATALVFVGIVSWFLLASNNETNQEEPIEDWTSSQNSEETSDTKNDEKIYVDIKGAVKKPGLYKVKAEMRVWDAIYLAGGTTDEAETKSVNFSQRIVDQMVILVPKIGEETNETKETENKKSDKININQADETTLQTLSGIGLKKAQEIIKYREENGGFQTVDELKNISGIGEKTIEKLKEDISVS